MDVLQAIILGIVQGITEWLPISSSGHLVIFQHFFNIDSPVAFDLMLHLGSLVVVFVFFWKRISELIRGVLKFNRRSVQYVLFMVLATIPIAFVGYFFKSSVEALFSSIAAVGFALVFTAIILYLSQYPKKKDKNLNAWRSFVVGIFQAVAIVPGVSRSGTTISSGMILGIKREEIAEFSFLIFIPAILGAAIVEIGDITSFPSAGLMILGAVVSAIVGFFTLKILMALIRKGRFHYFSIYCLVVGIAALLIAYL